MTDMKQGQKTMDVWDAGQRTGDMETLDTIHIYKYNKDRVYGPSDKRHMTEDTKLAPRD